MSDAFSFFEAARPKSVRSVRLVPKGRRRLQRHSLTGNFEPREREQVERTSQPERAMSAWRTSCS